jgi:hypothetical protein
MIKIHGNTAIFVQIVVQFTDINLYIERIITKRKSANKLQAIRILYESMKILCKVFHRYSLSVNIDTIHHHNIVYEIWDWEANIKKTYL